MFRSGAGRRLPLPGQQRIRRRHQRARRSRCRPAPASILYKEKSTAPEGGEYQHPVGAIAYDAQPSGSLTFTKGTGEAKPTVNVFNDAVRAHRARERRLRRASRLRPGPAAAEAQSLAEGAIASFAPSIAIGSPAGGSTVSTPSVVVSGSASDTGALASVSVNGVAATLEAGGAWSATVPLAAGANTITATATDQAGLTKSASVGVTYSPPPARLPLPSTPGIAAPGVSRGRGRAAPAGR